jgi:hypothetical protein
LFPKPRPQAKDTSPSEEVTAHQQRVAALFDALTKDLPAEPAARSTEQAARWLLAHALDWHRREEKVKWWEFFRMKDLSEEDLYDEKTAVAGLSLGQRMPKMNPKERAPIDQYHYPAQECSIKLRDTLYTLDEQRFGDVVAADPVARTIHALHLVEHGERSIGQLSEALRFRTCPLAGQANRSDQRLCAGWCLKTAMRSFLVRCGVTLLGLIAASLV